MTPPIHLHIHRWPHDAREHLTRDSNLPGITRIDHTHMRIHTEHVTHWYLHIGQLPDTHGVLPAHWDTSCPLSQHTTARLNTAVAIWKATQGYPVSTT
jgi:hypothetical protein